MEREEVKFILCPHVYLPGCMDGTAELPFPHMNWFSVCDVSYGQVFTDGICITKVYLYKGLVVSGKVYTLVFF